MTEHSETTSRKRELRRAILAERRATYRGAAAAASATAITAHLEPLIDELSAGGTHPLTIAGFSPTPAEASALAYLRRAAKQGHTILLPAYAGAELTWRQWDGIEALQPSPGAKFGAEPTGRDHGTGALTSADLILAPAVAVDRSGTRLGHGKGYYDRALVHRHPETPLVAVVHETEVLEAGALPREAHDVPIDAVLTEAGLEWIVAAREED